MQMKSFKLLVIRFSAGNFKEMTNRKVKALYEPGIKSNIQHFLGNPTKYFSVLGLVDTLPINIFLFMYYLLFS